MLVTAPIVSPTQEVGGAGTDGGDPGSTEPLTPLAAENADALLADVSRFREYVPVGQHPIRPPGGVGNNT